MFNGSLYGSNRNISITILYQLVLNLIQINSGLPVKQHINVCTVILIQQAWPPVCFLYAFVKVPYMQSYIKILATVPIEHPAMSASFRYVQLFWTCQCTTLSCRSFESEWRLLSTLIYLIIICLALGKLTRDYTKKNQVFNDLCKWL